jgi:hypothetical protein
LDYQKSGLLEKSQVSNNKNLNYKICVNKSYKLFILGTIKDYYLSQAIYNGHIKIFWCSSTSWVFSMLPEPLNDPDVV